MTIVLVESAINYLTVGILVLLAFYFYVGGVEAIKDISKVLEVKNLELLIILFWPIVIIGAITEEISNK